MREKLLNLAVASVTACGNNRPRPLEFGNSLPAEVAMCLPHRRLRTLLAAAITDLMTGDVIAELNDYVRESMVEALPAATVAEIAEQLDTDDAVQLIEDLDTEDQQAILAEMEPEDRAAIESALSYP